MTHRPKTPTKRQDEWISRSLENLTSYAMNSKADLMALGEFVLDYKSEILSAIKLWETTRAPGPFENTDAATGRDHREDPNDCR